MYQPRRLNKTAALGCPPPWDSGTMAGGGGVGGGLTEIYLCHACSDHKTEDRNARPGGGEVVPLNGPGLASAPALARAPGSSSSCRCLRGKPLPASGRQATRWWVGETRVVCVCDCAHAQSAAQMPEDFCEGRAEGGGCRCSCGRCRTTAMGRACAARAARAGCAPRTPRHARRRRRRAAAVSRVNLRVHWVAVPEASRARRASRRRRWAGAPPERPG
jgi:hypothetical protein